MASHKGKTKPQAKSKAEKAPKGLGAKAKEPSLLDKRLITALNHPTRAYALNVLTQRPASATELAQEIGEEPTLVAYHFDQLVKLGCIEEVTTRKRRGATERFYRATVRHYFDADAWATVPDKDRLRITMDVLRLVSSDLDESLKAGTVDAPDRHLSRTPMKLDEAGWTEILALLEATLEELLTIRDRAAKRMLKSGEKPRVAKVSIVHLETPKEKRS